MNARNSQLTGRLRLRHLLEVTEAASEEMAAERGRFERLADPGSAPRIVSSFQLFQTPPELAARVVALLGPVAGRFLEPSAGLGRLYTALRAVHPAAPVTLVEVSPECSGELYRATEGDANATLIQGDFLLQAPERLGLFDGIVMNPPFKMGTDVKHVLHARKFLAPGGRLVSLVANGPKQRKALKPLAAEWIDLPAASFASEGTRVEAAIVVIEGN